jgi:hypothetical protein
LHGLYIENGYGALKNPSLKAAKIFILLATCVKCKKIYREISVAG